MRQTGRRCVAGATVLRAAMTVVLGPRAAPMVPDLVAARKSSDALFRYAVARSLKEIGPPAAAARPNLKSLSENDPDDFVRAVASEAVRAIEARER